VENPREQQNQSVPPLYDGSVGYVGLKMLMKKLN
jgi:hypothetical protein